MLYGGINRENSQSEMGSKAASVKAPKAES
jgi:hypothetical protein